MYHHFVRSMEIIRYFDKYISLQFKNIAKEIHEFLIKMKWLCRKQCYQEEPETFTSYLHKNVEQVTRVELNRRFSACENIIFSLMFGFDQLKSKYKSCLRRNHWLIFYSCEFFAIHSMSILFTHSNYKTYHFQKVELCHCMICELFIYFEK